jgi:O-antigen ligase
LRSDREQGTKRYFRIFTFMSQTPFPITIEKPGGEQRSVIALTIIGFLCAAFLLTPVKLAALALFALVCACFAFYLLLCACHGNLSPFVLTWAVVFPLGYYFLSFPRERPLLTFDRCTVGLLLLSLIATRPAKLAKLSPEIRAAAIAWTCFVLAATLSIVGARDKLGALRAIVDVFLLPAGLGLYILRIFPVREHLKQLHILVALMAIYLAVLGAAEMYSGVDLLPLPGAGTYLAGAPGFQLLRVNGPFLSNNSYGLIGLLTLFLLLFLKKVADYSLPIWFRCLHAAGVACAVAAAMMPLFRSIALTLLLVLVLEALQVRKRKQRVVVFAGAAALFGGFFWLSGQLPDLYEERISGMDNIYARVAQEHQSFRIFSSSPLTGVGLTGFHDAAEQSSNYATQYNGVDALDYPHNNLSAVLAETGILGFVPYFLSQIFLVYAFLHIRKRGTPGAKMVWKYFIWIFLGYWISGLSLTSGYYSDLNLWFVFAIAILYKYSSSGDPIHAAQ